MSPKQRVCNGLHIATKLEWEMGGSELHSFLGACLRLEQWLDLPGGDEEGIPWSEGIQVRTLRLLVVFIDSRILLQAEAVSIYFSTGLLWE